jgi:hypothetical protein
MAVRLEPAADTMTLPVMVRSIANAIIRSTLRRIVQFRIPAAERLCGYAAVEVVGARNRRLGPDTINKLCSD